ncbi:MAG TPA: response regulator, partial [Nitrospira sp.]|nr:response regulator [Nitrospira sp.]
MKNILFVDDEPVLLDGLRRSLRSMRNEWTMTFADGGEEALKALEQTPFDVVVSDMRMPKMDGAQLLNEVQRRYPHIVRIVLSGYSDKEMILHSIRATHQFLAKPCEPEQLKTTIRRACALQDVLKNEALRALVTGMSAIPSLPAILLEIKQEAESETSSLKAIGKIIVKDMGLTAKILQLANSAFFGVRGPVSTVEQAVNFLGLETVQALILVAHVFSQFSAKHLSTFQIARLWEESLETGALAREIAKVEGCTPFETEQAYTAGLLHDMGILVLAANCADQFSAILAEAAAKRG